MYLSIIEGANEPAVVPLPRDEAYIAELVERADAFMACVYADVPPIAGAPLVAVLPSEWRTIDFDAMEAANEPLPNWSGDMRQALDEWLITVESAKRNDEAKVNVKKLLPEDVGRLVSGAVTVKRAKDGKVSIRGAR